MASRLRAVAGATLVTCALGAGITLRVGLADQRDVDPAAHYDAVIVLFGGYGAHHGVSAETHRRVRHALDLVAAGRADSLGCVGGQRADGGTPGSALACALAAQAPTPTRAVVVSPHSFDTWTNLRDVRAMAAERGWRAVALVSSPPHLGRIAGMLGESAAADDPVIGLLPYRYEQAEPAIGSYEVIGQVLYDRVARLLNAVLSPARATALAHWLRF